MSRVILTGAPGTGKTTLVAELRRRGVTCVDEPARPILAQQRRIGGAGVPDRDADLFTQLMLSRSLADYERIDAGIFDRGIPDYVAYAELFGLDTATYWRAARDYRYARRVYLTPPWREIYATDDERKMTFAATVEFDRVLRRVYTALDYDLVVLPCSTVAERSRLALQDIG